MESCCARTMEVYGSFITFPEISEKYLKRPPFKYIFQIFLSLQNKTAFAEGLLAREESSPDYYTTPERKMTFLKKITNFVYKTLDKPCALKAKSVIKGEECDRTNEFLCDLFAAANAKKGGDVCKSPQVEKRVEPQPVAEKEPQPAASGSPAREEPPVAGKKTKEKVAERNATAAEEAPSPPIAQKKESAKATKAEVDAPSLAAKSADLPADEPQKDDHRSIRMGTIADSTHYWSDKAAAELSPEEMRGFVQKVTQNTNPLGKLIDYAEDDLENMSKEHKNWVFVYHEATLKLEKLEGEQDGELESFNSKILQLDEQLLEYEEKVAGLRGKICRTDQKISTSLQKFFV